MARLSRSSSRERGGLARQITWKRFLMFEAVVALIYFPFGIPGGTPPILGVVPWMEWPGQVPAWAILGLASVAAIVLGGLRYRPRASVAWMFMGAGVFLFITGDTIYKSWHQLIGNNNIPFPSFIDAIYISMYPVLAIGLFLLARSHSQGRDRASLLDALIITLGVGLLSWIFLIGPTVRASGDLLARLTAAGYPLGDILVLAMLAHLWSAGGLRNAAGRLLALGTCGTLVADSMYGLANLHTSWNWSDGNPFDLGWILFYSCWGAAALHPSMRDLSAPKLTAPPRTGRRRLALLAAASLIAPIVLLVETLENNPVDASVIAGVAGVMFLLVVFRLAGVVGDHQKAIAREQVLRREASELVGAADRSAIQQATTIAVSDLSTGQGEPMDVAFFVVGPESGTGVVVASDGFDPANAADVMGSLPDDALRAVMVGHAFGFTTEVGRGTQEHVFLQPVSGEDHLHGFIMIRGREEPSLDLLNSIETLTAQVGLALDREQMTETLHARRSEARFQTLVQSASDVILIARPDTSIVYQTPSATSILGYGPGELEGKRLTDLIHPGDLDKGVAAYGGVAFRGGTSITAEWRIRHGDGSWLHFEVVANNLLTDPTVEGIVLTLRDVSERKSLEDELKHQAFHDGLSGLANRALFTDRLEHALARSARSGTSLSVLFLDLDDFKLVNDSMGHAAGDELLVAVAKRLTGCLSVGDTAARFGGDEFAVLLEGTQAPEDAILVAERVIRELKSPITVAGRLVQVHASIGVAFSANGTEEPSEILQAADVAMYAAKARGKNRCDLYQPALQAAVTERLEKTAELQRAVDLRQFVVHYQPIVKLHNGEMTGVEALVRWQHPERGFLLPKDFIEVAEDTGLIVPIGAWVLNEACRQTRYWQMTQPGAERLRVSVNISARHFQHDKLVEEVSAALTDSGLDANCLVLEITESLLVKDAEAVVSRMLELKLLGVNFAIDDFGTGYSSLSYLKRFPIDILKVDKSFVDDVGDSEKDSALATAIVQLSKSLDLDTVAEGIELERQVDELRSIGCFYGQGFLFARPVAPDELERRLPELVSKRVEYLAEGAVG